MRRLLWTTVDVGSVAGADCSVLVPESAADQEDLHRLLDDAGVKDRASFSWGGKARQLRLPQILAWEPDGALAGAITTEGEAGLIEAWFWVVEWPEPGDVTRWSVWWATQRARDRAQAWH